jgi:hypothetical protein
MFTARIGIIARALGAAYTLSLVLPKSQARDPRAAQRERFNLKNNSPV